ncbi:DUF6629 family protein [Streptomyces altiplanensis]
MPHPALLVAGRHLAVVGSPVALGAVMRAALRRLESVSARCVFAAVCSLVLLGWARPAPGAASAALRTPATGLRRGPPRSPPGTDRHVSCDEQTGYPAT